MGIHVPQKTDVGRCIGQQIQKLREKKDISQSELSRSINVSRTSISNYETGRAPTVTKLDEMIRAMGISWEEMGRMIDENRSKFKMETANES